MEKKIGKGEGCTREEEREGGKGDGRREWREGEGNEER